MKHQYLGVCPYGNQHRAQLFRAGRVFYLGLHPTPELAAAAYDRGAKLSAAWSKRRVQYNFEQPDITPASPALSKQEADMIAFLRLNFPDSEDTFEQLESEQADLMDAGLERVQILARRFEALGTELRTTLGVVQSALTQKGVENKEKDGQITFLRTRIFELEKEMQIYKLRKDPRDAASIFKLVVPKPAEPEAEPLTAPIL